MLRVFNVVKWTPLNGSSGGSVLGVTSPTCSVSHYYKPFLLWSLKWSEVAQSCPTLCDPMDCSLSGSSTHGIFQAECWSGLPFPSPGDLPNPGIEPGSPALPADALPSEPPGKPQGSCGVWHQLNITMHPPDFGKYSSVIDNIFPGPGASRQWARGLECVGNCLRGSEFREEYKAQDSRHRS